MSWDKVGKSLEREVVGTLVLISVAIIAISAAVGSICGCLFSRTRR